MAALVTETETINCNCCQEDFEAFVTTSCIALCPECLKALVMLVNGMVTRMSDLPAKTLAGINRKAEEMP